MIRLRLTSKGCCGGHRLKIVTLDGLSPSLASCASLSLSRTCNLSMRYESSYVSCCTIKPGNYSAICTWYGTFGVREGYINRWGSSAIVWFYWGVNENNLVSLFHWGERERETGGGTRGRWGKREGEKERGRRGGRGGAGRTGGRRLQFGVRRRPWWSRLQTGLYHWISRATVFFLCGERWGGDFKSWQTRRVWGHGGRGGRTVEVGRRKTRCAVGGPGGGGWWRRPWRFRGLPSSGSRSCCYFLLPLPPPV